MKKVTGQSLSVLWKLLNCLKNNDTQDLKSCVLLRTFKVLKTSKVFLFSLTTWPFFFALSYRGRLQRNCGIVLHSRLTAGLEEDLKEFGSLAFTPVVISGCCVLNIFEQLMHPEITYACANKVA
jgi:hypothetical protein